LRPNALGYSEPFVDDKNYHEAELNIYSTRLYKSVRQARYVISCDDFQRLF